VKLNIITNEDLVQKALLIIYQKYKTAKLRKGILPWAYRIMRNVMWNESRKKTRQQDILIENKEEIRKIEQQIENLEDQVYDNILFDEVKKAIRHLKNKEKRIIELKLEGYSGKEILEIMNIKRSALDVNVHRAINKLIQILERRGAI